MLCLCLIFSLGCICRWKLRFCWLCCLTWNGRRDRDRQLLWRSNFQDWGTSMLIRNFCIKVLRISILHILCRLIWPVLLQIMEWRGWVQTAIPWMLFLIENYWLIPYFFLFTFFTFLFIVVGSVFLISSFFIMMNLGWWHLLSRGSCLWRGWFWGCWCSSWPILFFTRFTQVISFSFLMFRVELFFRCCVIMFLTRYRADWWWHRKAFFFSIVKVRVRNWF